MSQSLTDTVATPSASPSAWLAQRIFGMPLPFFALALAVMAAAIATDSLPTGMIGALLVMMLLGELMGFIGDRLPVVKTYLAAAPSWRSSARPRWSIWSGCPPRWSTTSPPS